MPKRRIASGSFKRTTGSRSRGSAGSSTAGNNVLASQWLGCRTRRGMREVVVTEIVMGFEVFLVRLHGGTATHHEADEVIRRLPRVRPDPESQWMPGSTCFVMDDGQSVIE